MEDGGWSARVMFPWSAAVLKSFVVSRPSMPSMLSKTVLATRIGVVKSMRGRSGSCDHLLLGSETSSSVRPGALFGAYGVGVRDGAERTGVEGRLAESECLRDQF
jgi:hypothetical protein